ncbi:retroelement silencing factor 1 isoform X2 [Monodelphis domestica]|uniref:retroelement silencing factor 1 isoform X2 n=1 Tax=Monodelphis domestica TaxID=13616 RepID=UPI0024E2252F|nr:retroelement silencing factor 1 isoform X2 [Monodelphis domestica]
MGGEHGLAGAGCQVPEAARQARGLSPQTPHGERFKRLHPGWGAEVQPCPWLAPVCLGVLWVPEPGNGLKPPGSFGRTHPVLSVVLLPLGGLGLEPMKSIPEQLLEPCPTLALALGDY